MFPYLIRALHVHSLNTLYSFKTKTCCSSNYLHTYYRVETILKLINYSYISQIIFYFFPIKIIIISYWKMYETKTKFISELGNAFHFQPGENVKLPFWNKHYISLLQFFHLGISLHNWIYLCYKKYGFFLFVSRRRSYMYF